MADAPWVLVVDDDVRIQRALSLSMGMLFQTSTASSGEEAIEILSTTPGCGVVVSDMRMPGMGGADLLSNVAVISPDTTRILLTGYADVDAAIDAVNRGGIYRFLCKPCADEELASAIKAGLEVHNLKKVEKELLEDTVNGVVNALVDLLSIGLPGGFGWTRRSRDALRFLSDSLGYKMSWEMESAIMLARIGWLALPDTTLQKYLSGQDLDESEVDQFKRTTTLTTNILSKIPRFDRVSRLISQSTMINKGHWTDETEQLASVLRLEQLILAEKLPGEIEESLRADFRAIIAEPLLKYYDRVAKIDGDLSEESVEDLTAGYICARDIVSDAGHLIARRGTELTDVYIERLRNCVENGSLGHKVAVWHNRRPKTSTN